jgi:hypothetical protein
MIPREVGRIGGSATEEKFRNSVSQRLYTMEAVFYVTVGILLAAAAIVAVFDAGVMLWRLISSGTLTNYGLLMLDRVLLVLMIVEVLHTVRISIGSKEFMLVQPFLVVGLIATIRRVLVITMHAAQLADQTQVAPTDIAFRNAMIELGLLGFLTVVFAVSIYLLRPTPQTQVL